MTGYPLITPGSSRGVAISNLEMPAHICRPDPAHTTHKSFGAQPPDPLLAPANIPVLFRTGPTRSNEKRSFFFIIQNKSTTWDHIFRGLYQSSSLSSSTPVLWTREYFDPEYRPPPFTPALSLSSSSSSESMSSRLYSITFLSANRFSRRS